MSRLLNLTCLFLVHYVHDYKSSIIPKQQSSFLGKSDGVLRAAERERTNEKQSERERGGQGNTHKHTHTQSYPSGIRLLAHSVSPICWQMEGHYHTQNANAKLCDLAVLFASVMGAWFFWQPKAERGNKRNSVNTMIEEAKVFGEIWRV